MASPRYGLVPTLYGAATPDMQASQKTRTLSADGTGVIEAMVPATAFGNDISGWSAVAMLARWPGGVEIYGNWDGLTESTPTNFPNPPFQIDWQVFAGVGCGPNGGTLDDELQPTFQGSTVIKIGGTNRHGLLCQIGGTSANMYLIRARIPSFAGATGGAGVAKVSLSFRFLPGLLGPTRVVQAGSFIG